MENIPISWSCFINNFVSINDLKLTEDYSTINGIELLIITNNVPKHQQCIF